MLSLDREFPSSCQTKLLNGGLHDDGWTQVQMQIAFLSQRREGKKNKYADSSVASPLQAAETRGRNKSDNDVSLHLQFFLLVHSLILLCRRPIVPPLQMFPEHLHKSSTRVKYDVTP